METYTVKDVSELEVVALRVLEVLGGVEREAGAACLALHGDLGAGKTTFTQVLAKKLGVEESVVSPTFVVMKHYELPEAAFGFDHLYHIDAYRIEEADEMRPLHFMELLNEQNALVSIEWAERIESLLPNHTIHLNFTITGDARTITMSVEKYP